MDRKRGGSLFASACYDQESIGRALIGAPLTFAALDGVAFAAGRGRLDGRAVTPRYCVDALGPYMELRQLGEEGLLPHPGNARWLELQAAGSLDAALREDRRQWVAADRAAGFFRPGASWAADDTAATGFGLAAQKAATGAGFHKSVAAQFAAALLETISNIQEHSRAPETGVAVFRAHNQAFEFVVADKGVGVLESLRSGPDYRALRDHGEALRLALTDGISRHGKDAHRGNGFRPIFIGLANLSGTLRFRTGDHALVIDGHRVDVMAAKTAQKVPLGGFFVSVACRLM